MADSNRSMAAAPQLRLDEAGEAYSVRTAVQLARGQRWRAGATAMGFFVLFCMIFGVFLYRPPYRQIVGERAPATITATSQIVVVDQEATQAQHDRVLRNRPQVWMRDGAAISSARQKLHAFFDLLAARDPATPEQLRDFVSETRLQSRIVLDENSAGQLMTSRLAALPRPRSRSDVVRDLEFILNELLVDRKIVESKTRFMAQAGDGVLWLVDERGLSLTDPIDTNTILGWPVDVRQYLQNQALSRFFPGSDSSSAALRLALTDLLMQIAGPNVIYQVEASQKKLAEFTERARQARIQKTYIPGEIIVKQGEQLTPLQVKALEQLNQEWSSTLSFKLLGMVLFLATIFIAVGMYLRRFRREIALDSPTITLHAMPALIAVLIGGIIVKSGFDSDVVSLWFPSIMVGSITALLIAPQVAFILVLTSSLAFGIIMRQELSFIVATLFQGFAAVLATRQVRARWDILRVGLKVGLVNLFTLTLLAFMIDQDKPNSLHLMISFMTAMGYALLTYFMIDVFERVFGVITDLKLLELTGLQHKLMVLLEEKAPGSYQHVLNVTKLAEAGANAIGANYLLVRAGAYFHDVGKMLSPKYFSENQTSIEDKKSHSKISPYMSVLIIKNHVKEGIKLARDYKLPQRVIDFIPEHHGTSLIRYFYTEALKRYEESEAMDPVREEDFRYPGPKPRSIETAIVMLADSVEAITTSKFTGGQVQENELRRTVQQAITDKFNDGQFDDCNLTLRHLHMLREAFVKTLMARYHFRVQYPSMPVPRAPSARVESVPVAISGPAA